MTADYESATEPVNATDGTIWLDLSGEAPYHLKRRNDSLKAWEPVVMIIDCTPANWPLPSWQQRLRNWWTSRS